MTASTQFAENASATNVPPISLEQFHASITDEDAEVLNRARAKAGELGLSFAGQVTPPEAWQLVQDGAATLVDVRSAEERKFVGAVPDTVHVAWMTGLSLNRNPRFVKEFENKIKDKGNVVVLLCRSGKRSAAAAEALTNSGFTNIFNIEGGFEGEINDDRQRGSLGGWRFHSLPWIQD